MEYTQGAMGRIFVLKFGHGDDIHHELRKLAEKEKITSAVLFFIGAIRRGHLVTGPKKAKIPPVPNWTSFKDGWETLGLGTIFKGSKGSKIHVHVSMGKKNRMLTGCLRKESQVFLVKGFNTLDGVRLDSVETLCYPLELPLFQR